MRILMFLAFLSMLVVATSQAKGQTFAIIPPSMAHSLQSKINEPAAKSAIAAADTAISRPPNAVTVIDLAGRLPSDPIYKKTNEAGFDLPAMANIALAFRLTGDKKYLNAATKYITAWASVYKTAVNPINDQDFYYFFVANDLVQADMPADAQTLVKNFAHQYAEAYVNEIEKSYAPGAKDPSKKPDPTANNNFQSHRIKLAALAAFATGDKALIERAHAGFNQQVSVNLYPDGSVWDFHERDALHYVIYDLEPLLLAAIAAKTHGEDWYSFKSPSGSSVEKSLDWLIPYAEGQQSHEEFAHTTVQFDQTRAKAGVKGFSGAWDPKGSATTYGYASILDSRYRKVLGDVESHTGATPPNFIVLVFEQ
jgi:hypothetical protein